MQDKMSALSLLTASEPIKSRVTEKILPNYKIKEFSHE